MAMSDAGGETPSIEPWREVAEKTAAIIRARGLDHFRQAVRQVMRERLNVEDERERREQERFEALKRGNWYGNDAIPDRPEGDFVLHVGTLTGSIRLSAEIDEIDEIEMPPGPPEQPCPPTFLEDGKRPKKLDDEDQEEDVWTDAEWKEVKTFEREQEDYKKEISEYWSTWHEPMLKLFEYVKQRGFPDEDNGKNYSFQVCCWIPADLEPHNDRWNDDLLPVPKRELNDVEKIAVLAAIYDAHWRGGEKVAPWGLSEDGSEPEYWPAIAERDERRAALDYAFLFREAQQLDTPDLPVVGSWLKELEPFFKATGPAIMRRLIVKRSRSIVTDAYAKEAGEQAQQADESATGAEMTPQAEPNQADYSSNLVGNEIDDPTGPLKCSEIALILFGVTGEKERTKVLRWMRSGKLPTNLADRPKDHYRVSKSQLALLEKAERAKRDESNS